MDRMRNLLFSVCVAVSAYLLGLGQAFGAGVTIITHGFSNDDGWGDGITEPQWLARMGAAVGHEIVKDDVLNKTYTLYRVKAAGGSAVGEFLRNFTWTSQQVTYASPFTSNTGEIVIELDWSDIAGAEFVITPIIAEEFAALLTTSGWFQNLNVEMVETPIHLIGHSRGAAMMIQLAEKLGKQGLWINQVTTLDPHPILGIDDVQPLNLYQNVLFADNYHQTLDWPGGREISGSYPRPVWWEPFIHLVGGYVNYLCWHPISGFTDASEHSDVHLWYHGTIDTTSFAYDGEKYVTDDMRSDTGWYLQSNPNEEGGKKTGFYFSRIKGGTYTGGTRSNVAAQRVILLEKGTPSPIGTLQRMVKV